MNQQSNSNIDNLIQDKLFRMQLANYRKEKHWTQEELAKRSGLSVSCISSIESGENSSPTLRSVMKYLTAVGVELYIRKSDENDESQRYNNA